jgi:hypothetical protein
MVAKYFIASVAFSFARVVPSLHLRRGSDKYLAWSLASTGLQPQSVASSSYVIHI